MIENFSVRGSLSGLILGLFPVDWRIMGLLTNRRPLQFPLGVSYEALGVGFELEMLRFGPARQVFIVGK